MPLAILIKGLPTCRLAIHFRLHILLFGFAAETNDVEHYALDKLKRKNADMIVANDVSKEYAGFNKETNEVTIFQADKEPIQISVRSKDLIAEEILYAAIDSMHDDVDAG